MHPHPLIAGLRVIELAGVLAGPSVGLMLAELGAHVVKIENPTTGGDMTRHWRVSGDNPDSTVSAYYTAVNAFKSVCYLDIHDAQDLAKLHDMLSGADVLITNSKRSSAARWQLLPEQLQSLYPRLIVAEISAFGPHSDRLGFDVVLQAETGFIYMTGMPDQPPVKLPVALIDLIAGHQLKEGVLLALWQRSTTGQGCHVHVSLYDAAIASLANQAANWLHAGFSPQRIGLQHPNIAPYGDLLITKDNRLLVPAIGTHKQFDTFCRILGLPELINDIRFKTNASRVENRQQLIHIIQQAVGTRMAQPLLEACLSQQVPIGLIKSIPEVLEDQAARHLITEAVVDNVPTRVVRSTVFEISSIKS